MEAQMGQLNELKTLLGMSGQSSLSPLEIKKALTAAGGGTYGTSYSGLLLERQAKILLPTFAGMRNRTPVDTPQQGAEQVQYKAELGFGAFNFATALGTAEAGIGQDFTGNPVTIACQYVDQALSNSVTLRASMASQGYDDPFAIATRQVMSGLTRLEEYQVIGGNQTALSAPASGTAVCSTSTGAGMGTKPAYVAVTALTLRGVLANMSGAPAAVSGTLIGESNYLAITVGTGTTPDWVTVSWPAVRGAFAYKIYSGATAAAATLVEPQNVSTGAQQLYYPSATPLTALGSPIIPVTPGQTFVTVTSVMVAAAGDGTNVVPTAGNDGTANPNEFEGYWAWATKGTMYGTNLGANPMQIDMQGQQLTPIPGGIKELDLILGYLWRQWQTSPTLIVTSPNGAADLSAKILASTGNVSNFINIGDVQGKFQGGTFMGAYTNKFAGTMQAGSQPVVPIWAHPYWPDGNIAIISEEVPYPYTNESRAFALDVRLPYTYWELAKTDIRYPFSILFDETLKCYFPLAQASITGVRQA
jgi:hypothetical protein